MMKNIFMMKYFLRIMIKRWVIDGVVELQKGAKHC